MLPEHDTIAVSLVSFTVSLQQDSTCILYFKIAKFRNENYLSINPSFQLKMKLDKK